MGGVGMIQNLRFQSIITIKNWNDSMYFSNKISTTGLISGFCVTDK